MRALVGEHFADWADEAVVGLWDVLRKPGYFKGQFDRMLAEIGTVQPDALVFIHYPGFNLRLARRGAPAPSETQGHRLHQSAGVGVESRDAFPRWRAIWILMLCIFPFEKPLYEESGLHAVYVGHPMLDSLAVKKIEVERDPHLVGIFPGSREKEVRRLSPVMAQAALADEDGAAGIALRSVRSFPSTGRLHAGYRL